MECRKACPGATHKLISKHTCLGLENLLHELLRNLEKLIDKIFVELSIFFLIFQNFPNTANLRRKYGFDRISAIRSQEL